MTLIDKAEALDPCPRAVALHPPRAGTGGAVMTDAIIGSIKQW